MSCVSYMTCSLSLYSPTPLHHPISNPRFPCFPLQTSKSTPRSRNVILNAIPTVSTVTADLSSVDGTTIAVISGSAVTAMAAVLTLIDPERRRQLQAEEVGGGDKEVVKDYFNNSGFQRWRKIYGKTDDVNSVQRDIRLGHSKTVENALKMLTDEGPLVGITVCDAGCGTGSLSIPLAKEGAIVYASDISAAMVAEAQKQAKEQLLVTNGDVAATLPKFEVSDLESLQGKYDTVICLDVLIHYPQSQAEKMIAHLASLASNRLILSFAPKTFYYDMLKRIGELFPGPSKATRAYLHAEGDVERALRKVGWKIRKRGLITTQFYFARLVEAIPI